MTLIVNRPNVRGRLIFPITSLRITTILLILLLLFQPYAETSVKKLVKSHVVVLLDTSASMEFVDTYTDDEKAEKTRVAADTGALSPSAVSRLGLVQGVLGNEEIGFLARLAEKFHLHVYTFDSETSLLASSAESGLGVNNRRFSLAASWSDYDDDGDPDLYVANDFGKNNLYRNDGGKFLDVAEALGVEDTGNGMSVTWEDVDNDGHIDLYVGNMWSSAGNRLAFQSDFANENLRPLYLRMARGNSLFRNLGDGRFEDITARGGASFGRWSWSAQFLDVDGDGREDLYVCNGFISNEIPDDL